MGAISNVSGSSFDFVIVGEKYLASFLNIVSE